AGTQRGHPNRVPVWDVSVYSGTQRHEKFVGRLACEFCGGNRRENIRLPGRTSSEALTFSRPIVRAPLETAIPSIRFPRHAMSTSDYIGFGLCSALGLWLLAFPKSVIAFYTWFHRGRVRMPTAAGVRIVGALWILLMAVVFIAVARK